MKLSLAWLGRHVDLAGLEPAEIVERLTLSTCEVEGLERFLPHLADVVVGHVVERAPHPDADKLACCRVDVGVGEPLPIVCGAPNVAAGQRVAVARVGTTLPGDFRIKKAKIRGVESCGMICSERELGLGEEHDGIWVLPADAPVGRPVAEALGMEDWVIEIDNKSITHRPDLWSHRGMAREVAALFGRELVALDLTLPPAGRGAPYPVRVESEACSRYLALPLDGVRGGRSPDRLRALLLAAGQRPLDLLVDLSNFVMLDLGQPNHLFDRTRLSPEGIVVRWARAGEALRTLDGVERRLTTGDMLICSGDEPVALAGVMGGEGSKVEPGTSSLLLEVACFHPATVRRTSQRLGLRTDSSARFEKHLDPTLPMQAAARLVRMLQELQPDVRLAAPPTDAGSWTDPARTVRLRGERVRAVLGAEIPDAEIARLLSGVGFGVAGERSPFDVRVPSARATKDVTIEEDLIEEVGRLHRYGRIPERALVAEVVPPPRDAAWERRMLVRRVQDRLAGTARFQETISYSFLDDALAARLRLADAPAVRVVNPIDEGASRVRRSVVPSLLATLVANRRARADLRLFEVGKGYRPEAANERGEPAEHHLAGLVACGPPLAAGARFDAGALAGLQGVVEDVVRAAGYPALAWERADALPRDVAAWAHPGRALVGRLAPAGEPVVHLAALEPGIARALDLAGELASDVACAEISLDALLASERRPPGYEPLPRFPLVKVDVAVATGLATPQRAIADAIARAGKGLVHDVELFDLYQGASLGAGRKSLAYHVVLRSDARTLAEEDVQKFLQRVEREVAAAGGELRRE